MTNEEIIEMAIAGHASTRDAIRWSMAQEREACAKVCEENWRYTANASEMAEYIRARGQA